MPPDLPLPPNPGSSRLRWTGGGSPQRIHVITCILDLRSSWYVFSVDRGLSETEDLFPAGEIGAGQDAYFGRYVRLGLLSPHALAASTTHPPHFFVPLPYRSHFCAQCISQAFYTVEQQSHVATLVLQISRAAQSHSLGLPCPFSTLATWWP